MPHWTDYTLVSVLASHDGKSVAVVYKRTVKGARHYGFAVARVVENAPSCRAAEKPATEAQTKSCLAALEKLPAFDSTETTTDFEGGAVLPRYSFGFNKSSGMFSLGEAPAVGALFAGTVGACWQVGQTFTLRLTDTETAEHPVFDVQVVRTSATEATLASTSPTVDEEIPGITFVAAKPSRKR